MPELIDVLEEGEVDEVRWVPWQEVEQTITKRPDEFVHRPDEHPRLFAIFHQRYGRAIL